MKRPEKTERLGKKEKKKKEDSDKGSE